MADDPHDQHERDHEADGTPSACDEAALRCRERGLRKERTSLETASALIALASVAVYLASHSRSAPNEASSRMVAVMMQSVLVVLAWVSVLIAAGRVAQGRRWDRLPVGVARPTEPDAADHRSRSTRWALLGWLVVCTPVVLLPIGLWLAGVRAERPHGLRHALRTLLVATPGSAAETWLGTVLAVAAVTLAVAAIGFARLAAPDEPQDRAALGVPGTGDRRHEPVDGLVVAASGGGIRSTSFCLGGFNAVQQSPGLVADLKAVVAVSGGSYFAGAQALTRSFGADGEKRPDPLDVGEVYGLHSPELARLRRHSRYLWQPTFRTVTGLLQLAVGAALHLTLGIALLRATAWFLGWLLSTTGILSTSVPGSPHLDLWPDLGTGWVVAVLPWLAPSVAVVVLLAVQIALRGRRDGDSPGGDPSSRPWARLTATATRTALLSVVALIAVPALLVGLSKIAYDGGAPSSMARAVVALGLTDDRACTAAVQRSADAAWDRAVAQRSLTGSTSTQTYSACGTTGSVTASTTIADPSATARAQSVEELAAGNAHNGVGGQLTSVLVIVAGALSALRRGLVGIPRLEGRIAASARQWLLMRVPVMAMVAVAVWLLLLWTSQVATDPLSRSQVGTLALILAAVVVGVLDPNVTSMHEFYRERLSSAFAVGRDPDGAACPLRYDKPYQFSDLAEGPELVVCTTVNVNDGQVVPTRRAGVPLTFSRTHVNLEVGDLDDAAGHRPTTEVEALRTGPRLTVPGAIAMSGAAVSPLMGRMGARFAPFRLLMTLLNVRLGVWVQNPRWPVDDVRPPWWSPMATRPRLAQLLAEAVGSTDVDDRWLYVTDGGHLDNLGLVEAVRRGPRRVLVFDAGNDPAGSWQALGDAVSVIRADLGVDLVRLREDPSGTWVLLRSVERDGDAEGSGAGAASGRGGRGGQVTVLVVKAAIPTQDADVEQLPADVQAFRSRDRSFPRASTGRQDFGDLELEAYRSLGQHLTERALKASQVRANRFVSPRTAPPVPQQVANDLQVLVDDIEAAAMAEQTGDQSGTAPA
jgi:hypothetical protein